MDVNAGERRFERSPWGILALGLVLGACSVDVDEPSFGTAPAPGSSAGDEETGFDPTDDGGASTSGDSTTSGGTDSGSTSGDPSTDDSAGDESSTGDSSTGGSSSSTSGGGNVCGNGVVEQNEECDGNDFGNETCASQGDFHDGDLDCTNSCTIDTSDCIAAECGDGVKNQQSEDCDEDDLQGKDCTDVGWDWGELSCENDCSFDESECLECSANLDPCDTDADCCPGLSCSGWPLWWCS